MRRVLRQPGSDASLVGAARCGRPGRGLIRSEISPHPGRPHRAAPTEPSISRMTVPQGLYLWRTLEASRPIGPATLADRPDRPQLRYQEPENWSFRIP